jgi:mRNA interferase HicA
MNSSQFRRWLAKQGCAFKAKPGGGGHLIVIRGDRESELPMHGGNKQLGKGLIARIKKDLGLK